MLQKSRSLTTLIALLAIVFATAFAGCGRKNIVTRDSDPAMVSQDTKVKVFVKDAKGNRVEATRKVLAGEYVMGDSGAKRALATNAPPLAPKGPPGEIIK